MSEAINSIEMIDRFYNQPLLIDEETANTISGMAGLRMRRDVPEMDDDKAYSFGETINGQRRLYKVEDGVAIINVKGILEHDSHWYGSYWTGYDAIQKRFDMAKDDQEVRGIAWFFNTNGGDVSGNFDLADYIYRHRDDKPMIAIVNERAYSAGYSLASAVGNIHVTRTAGVGSIGVVTVHMDHSKWLKDNGIKPTLFFAGKHKVDGNPYEPVSAEVKTEIQERIDGLYTIFVDTVARNRNINPDAVRNTEAATFSGEEAVSMGLADVVMSANDALAAFKTELNGSFTVGETLMSKVQTQGAVEQQNQGPNTQAGATFTQEQVTAAEQAASSTAATTERDRIFAILDSDAAKGREQAAVTLAKNGAMDAKAAIDVLASLPAASGNHGMESDDLSALMAASGGSPNLGSSGNSEQGTSASQAAVIDSDSVYGRLNAPQ